MPQPPVTPSPHRFLLKPSRSSAPVPSPVHLFGTPQFNVTPRFKVRGSQRDRNAYTLLAEEGTWQAAAPEEKQATRSKEGILEDSDKHEDEKDGEDPNLHGEVVHESIETVGGGGEGGEGLHDDNSSPSSQMKTDSGINVDFRKSRSDMKGNDTTEIENSRSGKRRRTSFASYSSSTHEYDPYHVQEPASDIDFLLNDPEHNSKQLDESTFGEILSHISNAPPRNNPRSTTSRSTVHQYPPRFLPSSIPTPNLTSNHHTQTQNYNPFTKPPRFLPSESAASNNHVQTYAEDELPLTFSPHKRGRKYVAGGLAAEVARWLLDVGSREAEGGVRAEMTRVEVLETSVGKNGTMLILRGRRVEGLVRTGAELEGQVRLVLVGDEGGKKAKEVKVGGVIDIKGRGWEVSIEGVRWRLCLKWEVVS